VSPRENSVKHLSDFYTVIAGLALTTAILKLVNEKGEILSLNPSTLLLCLAFLATLLPFYHGALRHLDVTYAESDGSGFEPKAGAFLADFILLFFESCLFIVLAVKITEPVGFALVYGTLLLFDCLWGFLAHLAFSRGSQELVWAKINIITVGVLLWFLYTQGLFESLTTPVNLRTIALMMFIISVGRTIFDYWLSWKHGYYSWTKPPGTHRSARVP
jgi:hypothetical protein